MPTEMPVYEMIETVVLSYLRNGCLSGSCGSIEPSSERGYSVQCAGQFFTVYGTRFGWAVRKAHMIGEDRDLLEAARLVCQP